MSTEGLASVLSSEVLGSIARLSSSAVLYGQEVAGRLSRRRRFPRWDVYFDEYLGHQPREGALPGHYHDWPELATVLEGRLNVVVGSVVYEVQEGDWLVFRPGVSHAECALISGKTYRLFWMILLPDGQFGLHQTRYRRGSGYQVLDACHFLDVPPELRASVLWLAGNAWEPPEKARWELIKLVNWCLGALLGKTVKTIDPYHPRVAEAQKILESSVAAPPSVAELAQRVGLSPNYLSSLFHHYTGQTVRQFVQRRRVELARGLLADPALSIKEVGYRLGFRTPQHFTYVFHRTVGLSPAAYRRQLGKTI